MLEEIIMSVKDIPEIANLSTPEKILLVEDLWDSISSEQDLLSVPQSHKDELDNRNNSYNSSPGNLLTLSDLQERIEKRK